MAEATVSGLQSMRPDQRPFVLSRSGFLGIQRHAAVWTGGQPFILGAPARKPPHGAQPRAVRAADDRCRRGRIRAWARQVRCGQAIAPLGRIVRPVDGTRGADALLPRPLHALCAAAGAVELRPSSPRTLPPRAAPPLSACYRYCTGLALEAHSDGLPIIRPLFMHFDVPKGRGTGQFLLGDRVLAAPSCTGARRGARCGCRRAHGWTGTPAKRMTVGAAST